MNIKWIAWFELFEAERARLGAPADSLGGAFGAGIHVNNLWIDCWPVLANSEDSLNRNSAFSRNLHFMTRRDFRISISGYLNK